jgi:hypothetical protein
MQYGKTGSRKNIPDRVKKGVISGSATLTGCQYGKAGPAVFAGDDPGILKMITGGLVHNDTLGSAGRARVPDNVAGSGAHNIGM